MNLYLHLQNCKTWKTTTFCWYTSLTLASPSAHVFPNEASPCCKTPTLEQERLFPLSTSASQICETGLGKPSTTGDRAGLCGHTVFIKQDRALTPGFKNILLFLVEDTDPCFFQWKQTTSPENKSLCDTSNSQAANCCKIQQNQDWKWVLAHTWKGRCSGENSLQSLPALCICYRWTALPLWLLRP